MAAIPSGEKVVSFKGRNYRIITVGYDGSSTSVYTDQSATSVAVLEPASGGPTATLGSSTGDGNTAPTPDFAKEITLSAGASTGPEGSVTLVVAYGTSVGGSK